MATSSEHFRPEAPYYIKVNIEKYISLAEIAYKSGNIKQAIRHARAGLVRCRSHGTATALRIFIAKGHSKLGEFDKSNKIYRGLLDERNYLPPVVMGLVYNNFKNQKIINGLRLIKVFVR